MSRQDRHHTQDSRGILAWDDPREHPGDTPPPVVFKYDWDAERRYWKDRLEAEETRWKERLKTLDPNSLEYEIEAAYSPRFLLDLCPRCQLPRYDGRRAVDCECGPNDNWAERFRR